MWRATGEADPRLLADRVRVERWYDIEDAKNLLPGARGAARVEPRSAAAALARLRILLGRR